MPDMLTVSASEANRSFSSLLKRVKQGAHVQITSHGQTVAELRPKADGPDETEKSRRMQVWEQLKARLAAQEFETIGPWTRADLYDRD